MKRKTESREYAEALFELALESGERSEISASLDTVREVFESVPDYALLLESAFIEREEKERLIDEAFGNLHGDVVSLLKILSARGGISAVARIAKEYAALDSSVSGRVCAVITSATELSDGDRERIVKKLSAKFSKVIDAVFEVDPSLIGGVIVRCGDVVLDGTVKNNLLAIKEVIEK